MGPHEVALLPGQSWLPPRCPRPFDVLLRRPRWPCTDDRPLRCHRPPRAHAGVVHFLVMTGSRASELSLRLSGAALRRIWDFATEEPTRPLEGTWLRPPVGSRICSPPLAAGMCASPARLGIEMEDTAMNLLAGGRTTGTPRLGLALILAVV